MNNKQLNNSAITGYFATMSNETFEKGNVVQSGRSGVYRNPEDLISIINGNPAIKKELKDNMKVIKVNVPKDAIEHENCLRFSIKGQKVEVLSVQPFSKVAEKVMAVA